MNQESVILGAIIGLAIWIFLLYQIIKGAVRSANAEVERLLRILINMRGDELVRKGDFTQKEVNNIISREKS
jgi:hypothetical protein